MISLKHLLMVVLMAASLIAGIHIGQYFQLSPAAADQPSAATPSDDTLQLSERLIRFGQAAYDRGQYSEAKNFFQKAVTVYPDNMAAWKKYNMALLALISSKVETDPAFLPAPAGNMTSQPASKSKQIPQTEAADDGC